MARAFGGRWIRPRWLAAGVVLCASLGVSAAAAGAGADDCAGWPGEPDPVPALDDPDPLRARWAALRQEELARDARALEAADPTRAYLLWRRLRCFDAGNSLASAGVARTRPVRVHRPAVVRPNRRLRTARFRGDDPWVDLARAIPVGEPLPKRDPAERAAARQRLLEVVELHLGRAEEHLRQAHFREALDAGEEARARLDAMRRADDLAAPRIRLELLSATAQLALGDPQAARASLARALAIDPEFTPDPMRTPPKLMRAFRAARTAAGSPR